MAPFWFPWGPCPWGNQDVFKGTVTLELGLYAIFTTDLLDAFPYTLGIGYDNVVLGFWL